MHTECFVIIFSSFDR